jgi:hypothetical protein
MMEMEADETELEETTDDQKWTVTRASGTLLQEVSILIRNPIWTPVITFATEKLNNEDWMNQYIGMTALGSILSGPDPAMIYNEMENSVFPSVFSMFNNSAIPRVRYVTGWTIQSIAKNVPQLIFKSQENLEMMVNSGCGHMAEDHWTIRGFMATAFSDIFEAAAARDQK